MLSEPGPAHDPNPYGPAKWWFHLGCLVTLLALAGVAGRGVVAQLDGAGGVAAALAGAALGLVLADLASGVAHWLFDTYGSERTPVVGRLFIRLFRVHHDDPLNITKAGFVRINGDNSMVAGAFLGSLLALRGLGLGPERPLALALALAFALGIGFTNLFHQWSHRVDPPPLARWLHRRGWVLTPAAHQLHHAPPFRTDYCITFGWLNPLLERLRLFRRLEAAIERVVGAPPLAHAQAADLVPAEAAPLDEPGAAQPG